MPSDTCGSIGALVIPFNDIYISTIRHRRSLEISSPWLVDIRRLVDLVPPTIEDGHANKTIRDHGCEIIVDTILVR